MSKPTQAPLFRNRRFTVTVSDIRTPTTFYPVDETVGRLRNDLLFTGLGLSALIGVAFWRYDDLWLPVEKVGMAIVIGLALLIGTQFKLLQIDARGFPSRIFWGRTKTMRAVFHAITEAKAAAISGARASWQDSGND